MLAERRSKHRHGNFYLIWFHFVYLFYNKQIRNKHSMYSTSLGLLQLQTTCEPGYYHILSTMNKT